MVKHNQTIHQHFANELFECDYFVALVIKGLTGCLLLWLTKNKTEKTLYIQAKI